MQIERGYTTAGRDPLAGLAMRRVELSDGRRGQVPQDWTQRAAQGLCAQMTGDDGAVDLRRAADRLAVRLRARADAQGRIPDPADAAIWADEMRYMIAQRIAVVAPEMWSGHARSPQTATLSLSVEMAAVLPQDMSRLSQAVRNGAPLELRFGAAPVTPRVVLDLGRFVADGAVAIEALVRAVRVWTLALAVDAGQGAIGLAGMGGALMRLGLGPATREGRVMAAAMAALVEAARLAAAAELGLSLDAAAGGAGLARLRARPNASCAALLLSRASALREGLVGRSDGPRAPRLVIAPLGDAAAILGTRADPFAPLTTLTIDTETPTGHRRVAAPELVAGLAAQGHGPDRIAALLRHVVGHGSLAAAPGIDHATLRACGLDASQIARVEAALPEARDLRAVITPWRLGRAFCADHLGFAPEEVSGHGMELLERLGFTPAQIEQANRHVFGHGSLQGARGIDAAQAAVFDAPAQEMDLRARLALAGEVSAMLEGPVTALLPLGEAVPVARVARAIRAARRAGLAALVTSIDTADSPPLAARLREILAMLPSGIRPGTTPAEVLEILDAAGRSRPEARRHARALRERLLSDPLPQGRTPRRIAGIAEAERPQPQSGRD